MIFFTLPVPIPGAVHVEHIDATPLGMVAGGVVTGAVVVVAFLLIGWLLIKYRVVTIGSVDAARDRIAMNGDRIAMAGDRNAMAEDRLLLSGHVCRIPEDCPKHGEEMARSLENKADIAELKAEHTKDRDLFWKEFRAIRRGITCITNGLLAKQIIDPHDLPRGMED